MEGLKDKPALKILIPFVVGILWAYYTSPKPSLLLFLFALCVFGLVVVWIKKSHRLFLMLTCTVFVLAGALNLELMTIALPDDVQHYADLPVLTSMEGTITSPVDKLPLKQIFVLRADSLWILEKKYPTSGQVLVSLYEYNSSIEYGDRLVLRGDLRTPPGERNPGDFNYQKYLAAQNIQATLKIENNRNIVILDKGGGYWFLRAIVYPARQWVIRVVEGTVQGQPAALLKGLLVGTRGEIEKDLMEAFANIGVIHILSVSGLHVGFVVLGLIYFLQLLQIKDPLRAVLVVLGLVFYTYLTGASAPVIRSAIMAAVVVSGLALQRQTDVVNSISIAAWIILAMNPLQLFEASFQLSFVAILGIIFIYTSLKKIFKSWYTEWQQKEQNAKAYIMDLFLVSLGAQLATLPLTIYYYSRIPLLSIAANLIVVPLSGINIALGFISVFLALVYWPLGVIYSNANWLLLTILIGVVRFADKLPGSFMTFCRPSFLLICIYAAFLILLAVWDNRTARRKIILAILVIANIHTWHGVITHKQGLTVTFFDVGQGDSALFEFPDGRTLLIDAGDQYENYNSGERVIAPYLNRHGIGQIDKLVLTHGHSDHSGGCSYLFDHFTVKQIIRSNSTSGDAVSARVDSLIKVRNIPLRTVSAGDTIAGYRGALIMVLSPDSNQTAYYAEELKNLNLTSLVLKVVYGRRSFLLTGDAEMEAEKDMLCYTDLLQSDVLKVSHHGSATGSSEMFCRTVKPDYAVISVAKWNRFGLPSRSLLDRLQQQGMDVTRTDEHGAVIFFTDGEVLKRVR
jgi:competence protein ComEC